MRRATGYDTRGANDFRPSRKEVKETKGTSHTALICEAGKHTELHTDRLEPHPTDDDTIMVPMPDRSLSTRLHLSLFPQSIETTPNDCVRRDPVTGYVIEVIKRNRRIWQSDKSLLTRGTPEAKSVIKRETARTKRLITDRNDPAVIEISTELTEITDLPAEVLS